MAQDSPKLSRGAQRPKRVPAYTKLAEELRQQVRDQRYSDGGRLPIETELSAAYGVSRQTVRRAFQDLVSEGIVYRVPGRGTFATDDPGRYTRSFNSIEDLLRISLDTELEVVQPPTIQVDLAASGRLRLSTDQVVTIRFRRFHENRPFCTTQAFLPVEVGRQLFDVPELNEVGVRRRMTVLSVVQRVARNGTLRSGPEHHRRPSTTGRGQGHRGRGRPAGAADRQGLLRRGRASPRASGQLLQPRSLLLPSPDRGNSLMVEGPELDQPLSARTAAIAADNASHLAAALHDAGITLMYGVPGGNNLRVIAAASSAGCRFILTHTETAAVIMAGVTAELTGRPCAAIATRGPGAASAVNGMAQALLDRQAVLLITDRIPDADRHRASHQRVDQARLLGTVAKASVVMGARDGSAVARAALDAAADGMPGPVHIDYDESSESDVTFARGDRPGISPPPPGPRAEMRSSR